MEGDVEDNECVVLVTGGSGFLGQHVIKLLQSHADHVTSILVLDIVPFINKLDYKATKPVYTYVGDITNEDLMRKAMDGCHSVIHVAGFADSSMLPDTEKLQHVNVKGTMVTSLAALRTPSVQRLIGCGSMSVAISDHGSVVNGNEDTPLPSRHMFEEYASSKYTSELLVLEANCELLQTAVIRPVLMYGELDNTYMPVLLNSVKSSGGTFYRINNGNHIHQHAYVGNVAWAFVCAEKQLYKERNNELLENDSENEPDHSANLQQFRSSTGTSSGKTTTDDGSQSNSIAGHVFFAADDTPHQNIFDFQEQFIEECGYSISKWTLPYSLVLGLAYLLYFFLIFMSFFGFKKNMPLSVPSIRQLAKTNLFSYEKARNKLNYSPLFTPETSAEMSKKYYKWLVKGR